MSVRKTKTTKDVSAVTALTSAQTIMVTDTSGNINKISLDNLKEAILGGDLSAFSSALSSLVANTNNRWTRKTDFDLSTLQQAVAEGNLEKYGLQVGDQKTINGYTYVIAGLNPMRGTVTPYRVNVNHVGLIVIPHATTMWNASGNTYTGADGRGAGYANSDLHYYLTNTTLPHVKDDLGAAHLIGHSCLLSNNVNAAGYNKFGVASGCSSAWGWVSDVQIVALSEVQVYGSAIWSSSGFDTGEACRQLDVFQKYSHTVIFGGEYPWLRDVASATGAASVGNGGYADFYGVTGARYVAGLILYK